jgi:hypothetical protein
VDRPAYVQAEAVRPGLFRVVIGCGRRRYECRHESTVEPGRRSSVDAVSSYRISELARLAAVPASALLFYKQAGLLLADGTGSGYRVPQAQRVQDAGSAFLDQHHGP